MHRLLKEILDLPLQGSGGGGGSNAKERDSPSFRSPEAGISEFGKRLLHYVTLLLQPSSHVLKLIK